MFEDVTPEMKELLIRSASPNRSEAEAASNQIAKAIELPLREGIMSGDILQGIFEGITLEPGVSPEMPLDFLSPGTEDQFVAYAVPNQGNIPQREVKSDFVTVPTYEIGNSITWLLKYAKNARWDVVSRCMQVFEAGFVKKMNDDGFHTILAGGVDRNIVVYDADATAGLFTKRLISLLKTTMRRNGGGNSTSMNRRILTDLFTSPEAIEDMRNWGIDIVDEITRRELYTAQDGSINRVFGVNLRDIDELGVGQVYQTYFTSVLGGSMGASDVEIVVGLDLSKNGAFVMPNRGPVEVNPYVTLREQRKDGVYGTAEIGFGVLDTRYVILGSF